MRGMSPTIAEKFLYWIIRVCAYGLPFTLLIIANSMFFPFISGKNFAFRVIVEIMAAAWLGLLVIDFKRYAPRWSMLSVAFAVFVGALFVSAVFGIHFQQSFWSNFERMDGVVTQIHLFALFLILTGVFKTRREWFSLFAVSIVVSVGIAMFGFFEYLGKISFNQGLHSRIIATLGNPLYVAAYLSFHVFLIAYFLTEARSAMLRWCLGTFFFIDLAVIFLTQSRGAFVAMIVGGVITLSAFLLMTADRKKKIAFGILTLGIILVPFALYLFKDIELVRNNALFSRFSNISLDEGQTRFVIWNMAFQAFKEKPILGWGSENFIVPFAKYYDPRMFHQEPWFDRAHNMFLEWLVAGGAVGFTAYLFFLFAVFWTITKAVRGEIFNKKQAFIFIGMFIAYLIQLLFVFDTLGTYLLLVFSSGFFFAASFYPEEWRNKNSITRDSYARIPHARGSRHQPSSEEKIFYAYNISALRLFAIAGVCIAVAFVAYFANARPFMANRALMDALNYFNQQKFSESSENFESALQLSKNTIGETEIAEHLAFNVYNLFLNPDILRSAEGEALYRLTRENLEKQIAKDSKKYPNTKHIILLAQLYHQKALLEKDTGVLQKAFEYYEKVIFDSAPNYVGVYPVYAGLLAQTGNPTGAAMLTEKASNILKSAGKYDTRIFYAPALFYASMKRYNEAYEVLKNIAEKYGDRSLRGTLDPEMVENIVALSGAHGKDAIPFLEKIYTLDKQIVSVHLMLAQIYASLDEKERARFYALEALKNDDSIRDKVQAFLKALEEK